MANNLHDLKQNKMTFEARGLIIGTKSKNFYRSGTTNNGNVFNEISFGLTIAPQKTIYVKLTGYVQENVYYYGKKNKDDKKGQSIKVAWKDRKESPAENFRLIGINISVDRDGDKNVNEVMVPYDAVEYLHNSLKDGESYFIRGEIKPSSFINKEGNVSRKVELILNQMFYTKSVDFDDEDFEPQADIIIDPFVFSSIDKETDEDDKFTGRYILQGYDIGYNSIELMNFIVEASDESFAKKLKKRMKPGYSMKMFGEISVVHNIVEEEDDGDDNWDTHRKSKKNVVKASSKYEYVLFDVDGKTFDAEEYSEDGIAKAIKAIKNAKDAEVKFADKNETKDEPDWGSENDDIDDDSDLWGA